MLTVHHLNNSRSQRIVWLCEELDLDYKLVKHQRNPKTHRSPDSLNAIHPLGKAPTIEHDGKLIAETDAVIEYICHKLAGGRLSHGPDSADYGEYLQWLAFSEGTLIPPVLFNLICALTGGAGNDVVKGFYDAEIVRNHQYLEETFADREYIVKSGFSAADINLGWTLEYSEGRELLTPYPRLQAYLARLRARPGYKRSIERGGPQDLRAFTSGGPSWTEH
jgi:glutathione S-transferase